MDPDDKIEAAEDKVERRLNGSAALFILEIQNKAEGYLCNVT